MFTAKFFDKWLVNRKYAGEFDFGVRYCNNNMHSKNVEPSIFEATQKRLQSNRYS